MNKNLNKKLICLGIESTAHTFGVGIVDEDGVVARREFPRPERIAVRLREVLAVAQKDEGVGIRRAFGPRQ